MPGEFSGSKVLSLIQISSLVNSSLDIIEVLNSSMRFVEELVGAEASAIFEIDFKTNELFFRIARGDCSGKACKNRIKIGEGIAGWVAGTGDTVVVVDTDTDPRFSNKIDGMTGFKTKSIIAVPVRRKGQIIGVLEVLNKKGPHPFNDEDVDALIIAASQIGIALENARLYTRLKNKFELTQEELRESQVKLIRSERMAALGKLAHSIAHTVRNPVTSIGGFARRLKNKLPQAGPVGDYLNAIITESERLESMVKSIHDYSSMPDPEPKQIKTSVILDHAMKIWGSSCGDADIIIECNRSPEDPLIFADKDLISKALILLMQNAGEAISDDGVISVSVFREDKWIVISVRDNGAGISSEDLPHVFDPFFSTKVHGSGFGLTIVHHIVSGHRGEIIIESSPGKGTDVKLKLPPYPGDGLK